jgi:hypothetical protein
MKLLWIQSWWGAITFNFFDPETGDKPNFKLELLKKSRR